MSRTIRSSHRFWWQQIGDVNSGAFTPQQAMDRSGWPRWTRSWRVCRRRTRRPASVYGGCGPRLNEEKDESTYWLESARVGAKAKLVNEKPQGRDHRLRRVGQALGQRELISAERIAVIDCRCSGGVSRLLTVGGCCSPGLGVVRPRSSELQIDSTVFCSCRAKWLSWSGDMTHRAAKRQQADRRPKRYIHDATDLSAPEARRPSTSLPGARPMSGKTTLLMRLMAGLERPTSGEVWFEWRGCDRRGRARKRSVSHGVIKFVRQLSAT